MDSSRLEIFKRIVLKNAMRSQAPETTAPTFDPNAIQTAVAMGMKQALSQFTTPNGSLRIQDSQAVRPYGGG